MVRSQATMPESAPAAATVWFPVRMACRPVISAAREGVHWASGAKLRSWKPSWANWSIRRVSAPRKTPPP